MCKDVLIFHVLCSGLPEDHVQNIVLTAKKNLHMTTYGNKPKDRKNPSIHHLMNK